MSYKETFDLNYGMNKWEAVFEPIKPDNSEVKPFIDIAVYLLHLACELGEVNPAAQTAIEGVDMLRKFYRRLH